MNTSLLAIDWDPPRARVSFDLPPDAAVRATPVFSRAPPLKEA
jgi:hypothetical protein